MAQKNVQVRVYKALAKEEMEKCFSIRKRVFSDEQQAPDWLVFDDQDKESIIFLAEVNGEEAGTGRMRVTDSLIKFERISTLAEMRDKKVGAALMRKMQEVARSEYPEYLPMLYAQSYVTVFYQKLGWVPLGPLFSLFDVDHQLMIYPPQNQEEREHLKCLHDSRTLPLITDYLNGMSFAAV